MKTKLTVEMVMEWRYSFKQCVRYYFPDASDELCEFIIWEKTPYPFSTGGFVAALWNLYQEQEQKTKTI